ncbi:MAG: TIGR01777 family oxidoreductase [Armatimonadota bacterium]
MINRIVLCGGTGLIGSALSTKLKSSGYEVLIVTRSPKKGEYGWDRLQEALEGSLAVVNLSGKSIACKFTEENKREILSSRIETAKMVSDAINLCVVKPTKWINASATGFYGDRGHEVLTELSLAGSNFSAETCITWEDACLKSSAETEKVVIRIGVVLSAKGGVLAKLVPLVKAFLGGSAGNGNQWISWIHLDDIVRVIQWTIENECPQIVNGSNQKPVQNKEFMAWLRRIYSRPWSPPVPAVLLKVIGNLFGPDSSLVLDSCRVVPYVPPGFSFEYPTLGDISLTDL